MPGVKTKICAAALIMSGCVMMVFAAKVDPCTEKYNSCTDSCLHAKAGCRARGAEPDQCEKTYQMCLKDCEKAKKDCDAKAKK
jgi:hypothetical protein